MQPTHNMTIKMSINMTTHMAAKSQQVRRPLHQAVPHLVKPFLQQLIQLTLLRPLRPIDMIKQEIQRAADTAQLVLGELQIVGQLLLALQVA